MDRPMRIYIAGPMSKMNSNTGSAYEADPEAIERADQAAQELILLGCLPFCPHTMSGSWFKRPEPAFHDYKIIVETLDFSFLQRWADAILLLPGWENSKGARLELEEANRLNLIVFSDFSQVAPFVRERWPNWPEVHPPITPPVRHGHPRFYELLDMAEELHSRKNHDYAGNDDPLRNLRTCEGQGLAAWKGIIVRLGDKFTRLQQFAKTDELEVKSESIVDTFMDNAIYSLLGIILYEEHLKDEED